MVGKTYDRMVAIRSMATKTEKKLIDSVMKMEKSDIVYLSITELSARLKVAEATIVRFCKKLGYKGFQAPYRKRAAISTTTNASK